MKICLITSLPSAACQVIYSIQTRGFRFQDVIVVGKESPSFDILREYASINRFGLYFVENPNDETSFKLLKNISPDVIMVQGNTIIRKPLLEIPKIGTINVHAGWLPEFRGLDSPHWAVLEGGKLGCVVHFVDEGVDTGPILVKRELEVLPGDTIRNILQKNHAFHKWQAVGDAFQFLKDGGTPEVQPAHDKKQYFEMHPTLTALVDEILEKRATSGLSSKINKPREAGSQDANRDHLRDRNA